MRQHRSLLLFIRVQYRHSRRFSPLQEPLDYVAVHSLSAADLEDFAHDVRKVLEFMAEKDDAPVDGQLLEYLRVVGRLADLLNLVLNHLYKFVKGVGGAPTVRQLLLNQIRIKGLLVLRGVSARSFILSHELEHYLLLFISAAAGRADIHG